MSFASVSRLLRKGLVGLFCAVFFVSDAYGLEISLNAPKKVFLGEPFLVSVTSGCDVEKCTLSWRGRNFPVRFEKDGEGTYSGMALLGTDAAGNPGNEEAIKVWIVSGGKTYMSRWGVDVLDKIYPSEKLSVSPSMVIPPSSERKRIARERNAVRKALATCSPERFWTLPMERPVPGVITSVYGKRRVYNGIPKSRHGGVDYRAAMGTSVRCASAGRVILTGDHYYAGKSVYVDHGGAVISMYFHLSEIDVREGDTLKAGDRIGKTGHSGRVTGPHLHFGISIGGRMVDPTPLVEDDIDEISRSNLSGRISLP